MRALISVSDKTNLIELATQLHQSGVELISTGGTQKAIADAGLPVKNISEITGFPEILDGRVKTLHPKVHGGLLGKSNEESHLQQMKENDIERIDFVVVNLYPFKQTISKPNVGFEECIENIDIGGPSMLRSAAKNFEDVVVLCDANDYLPTIELWKKNELIHEHRKNLAAKVFRHTASYDALIAGYLTNELFPEKLTLTFEKQQDLRYGENPHQQAAFYNNPIVNDYSVANAKQLHGKELSYNNIQDANAAIQIVNEFNNQVCAVAIKHSNPCGVGIGANVLEAFTNCYNADSTSIFGGIVAVNAEVDLPTAELLSNIFLEIIIAPSYSNEALELLSKKKNIRLLELENNSTKSKLMVSNVAGGLLVQEVDNHDVNIADCKVVTHTKPTSQAIEAANFLWKVVKHVKSNAIVVGNNKMTLGVGAGQMNRVGSAKIALEQAGELAKDAVLVSDAFFPMRDTVDLAVKYGISTIVQTGGSIKDEEVIAAANEHKIAMIFTGVRHFKH
ncbi:MAG: bifunctional phosphoribosylaminoimidazolecarboxamide formyltransferase/IMP cyclohydrolase [Chitinophagaceae bacterium]